MIVIGAITVASVFALRKKWPDRARPYRATGYPWFPGLYLLASAIVACVMIFEALTTDKEGAWFPLVGLGILVVAFAAHKLATVRRAP
jgi:APA family basic amino acid/polyamine antiporter